MDGNGRKRTAPGRFRRLTLERLEDRFLLSGAPPAVSAIVQPVTTQ
jgi:hypothetical protein